MLGRVSIRMFAHGGSYHRSSVGGSLESNAEEHEERTNEDRPSPSQQVDEWRSDEQSADSSDTLTIHDEAEFASSRLVEVVLPLRQTLHAIEHTVVVAIRHVGNDGTKKEKVELEQARIEEPVPIALGDDMLESDTGDTMGAILRLELQHGDDDRCWWMRTEADDSVRRNC